MKDNECCKNHQQIKKDKVFQLLRHEENNFQYKYQSDFITDSKSNKFKFNGKEEIINKDHIYEKKLEETDTP